MSAREKLLEAKRRDAEELLGSLPAAPEGEAGWARDARAAARARLLDAGAPVRRDEYWKYTDPEALTIATPTPAPLVDAGEAALAADALRIVFVDGVFAADLSDPLEADGLEIQTLAQALATDIHWGRDLFGVLEARAQDPVARPMATLNTAGAAEGVVIRATGSATRPIRLDYRQLADSGDAMLHHVVSVEAGASLTLVEDGAGAARLNTVIEADIAAGGRVNHLRSQGADHGRAAVASLFARLGEGSALKSFSLSANSRYTRNESFVEFTGDDAIAHLAGAAMGVGGVLHDDTVFLVHDAERCESRQVFKKVLRSGAAGVFQGKILVKPGAQKTDGYQLSQALILDDASQFNAKPELEIYADDVKCSHGSTTGSVDPDQLFYLRARGITAEEARDLLIIAFLEEAVDEIEDDALAEAMRERIEQWMAGHRV